MTRPQYAPTGIAFVALLLIAGLWAWLLARSDGSAPVIAAPQRVVETVIVVQTPTYTPTPERTPTPVVVIVTVTPNRTATATIPPCWEASGGSVCIRFGSSANTATAVPWCRQTVDHGVAVICRKDTDGTEQDQEVGDG